MTGQTQPESPKDRPSAPPIPPFTPITAVTQPHEYFQWALTWEVDIPAMMEYVAGLNLAPSGIIRVSLFEKYLPKGGGPGAGAGAGAEDTLFGGVTKPQEVEQDTKNKYDPSIPLFLVRGHPVLGSMLVDGWHRWYKAYLLGWEVIAVYLFDAQLSPLFVYNRVESSISEYRRAKGWLEVHRKGFMALAGSKQVKLTIKTVQTRPYYNTTRKTKK